MKIESNKCPSNIYSLRTGECLKLRTENCMNNICKVKETTWNNKIYSYTIDRRTKFQKLKDNPVFRICYFIIDIPSILII